MQLQSVIVRWGNSLPCLWLWLHTHTHTQSRSSWIWTPSDINCCYGCWSWTCSECLLTTPPDNLNHCLSTIEQRKCLSVCLSVPQGPNSPSSGRLQRPSTMAPSPSNQTCGRSGFFSTRLSPTGKSHIQVRISCSLHNPTHAPPPPLHPSRSRLVSSGLRLGGYPQQQHWWGLNILHVNALELLFLPSSIVVPAHRFLTWLLSLTWSRMSRMKR